MIAVRDLMTRVESYAVEEDSLADVVTLMRANNHSCVVVVSDGRVRGILTERDLAGVLARALAAGRLDALLVKQVMTPEPICVDHGASLLDALTLARSHQVRHLPVSDCEGRLLGIITHTDMINAYVAILERQAELISTNHELRTQSRQDPLLGVGNRRALEIDIRQVAAQAQRHQRPYAVVLLDLDWFKKYNDHYGHPAGDLALRQASDAVQQSMRQGDSLYRYGGEELLLLMPDTDQAGGLSGANRARVAVEALGLIHELSPLGILTTSAGVASGCEIDPNMLIAVADKALYLAKAQGHNQVCGDQAVTVPVLPS